MKGSLATLQDMQNFKYQIQIYLFIYTKFKHFTDKYKKLEDNKMTKRLSGSVATLLSSYDFNNKKILLMPIKFVNFSKY